MDYFTKQESFNLALRGIFTVSEMITYEYVEDLCKSILGSIDDETEEITLLISSPGGSVDGATCFADFASLFERIRLHGVAVGECGSSAFAILQCCHMRTALRNCIFAVHYMHFNAHLVFDGTQREQAIKAAEVGTKTQKLLDDLICHRSGIKRSEWRRLIREGEKFGVNRTADEMLKLGLVDKVVDTYPLF